MPQQMNCPLACRALVNNLEIVYELLIDENATGPPSQAKYVKLAPNVF